MANTNEKITLLKEPYKATKMYRKKNRLTGKITEEEREVTMYNYRFVLKLNTGAIRSVVRKSESAILRLLHETIIEMPSVQTELNYQADADYEFQTIVS